MFRMPTYAAPPSFTNDAYMNHPRGTQGAASMVNADQQQPVMNQAMGGGFGQQDPQQQLGQSALAANSAAQQGNSYNSLLSQSGMQQPQATYNPSLANAMQQFPGAGRYLNRGMGGAPGTGVPQPIRGPRRMSANPQMNRIAGVQMP